MRGGCSRVSTVNIVSELNSRGKLMSVDLLGFRTGTNVTTSMIVVTFLAWEHSANESPMTGIAKLHRIRCHSAHNAFSSL